MESTSNVLHIGLSTTNDGKGEANIGFEEINNENDKNLKDSGVLPETGDKIFLRNLHHADVGTSSIDKSKTENDNRKKFETDHAEGKLIYKISDAAPIHLTIFFGLQQALMSLSTSLAVSLLVADFACAEHDEEFKSKLLSSTLFMNGVTTLLMVTIGVRLPLYQGATTDYVAPLVSMSLLNKDRCNVNSSSPAVNSTVNMTSHSNEDDDSIILHQIQMLQGSLLAAGAIHFVIGATGLVGLLLRFIGPVTIVPTILLIGIYMVKPVIKFAEVHWGVAILTCSISIILSLYLAKVDMPLPFWSKEKSCHVTRYPFHQVFAILIALVIGWIVCMIMTECGVFDNATTVDDKVYYARTDLRSYVIEKASWFYFPYPGQFGGVRFSISIFVGFLVATVVSILDSIGDYYACAAICQVPPPPAHSVNRGIAIEGLCSALSGVIGCGHATTTYGANIGAIGLTRVASRRVFLCVGCIYLVFGIIGKVSAVFITIPHPVLGGILIIMYGAFNGVVLSNLKSVDLSSTRNLTIIGTSLLVGLMVPQWVETQPNGIDTGNKEADDVLKMLLGNPNLIGGMVSCLLDNTVPGTKEERGIAAWQTSVSEETVKSGKYVEGYDLYKPFKTDRMKNARLMKYLPFMPNPDKREAVRHLSLDFGRRKSLIHTVPMGH